MRGTNQTRHLAIAGKGLRIGLWQLDTGSVTGFTAGFLAVGSVIFSALGLALAAGLAVVKTQAQADLAALSAADTLVGAVAGFPCENAELVIKGNGAHLTTCRIVGLVAQVSLSTNLGPFRFSSWAEAGQ